MTEFEMIEASIMVLEFVRSAAMDFVAVFFAYCVCAHVVGREMPRAVVVGVTVVYTLFLINPFLGMIGGATDYLHLRTHAFSQFPDSVYFRSDPDGTVLRGIIVAAPFLGWIASLLYMHVWIRRDESPISISADEADQ